MTFPILTSLSFGSKKSTYVVFKCEYFIVNTNELYEDIFTIIISI